MDMSRLTILPGSRWQSTVLAGLVAIACLAPALFLTPYWGTNDDVGMAMLAGGFGNTAEPTPLLIHSNVIWGYLVQGMPDIGSLDRYSVLYYLVALTCLFGLAWCLLSHSLPPATCLLVLFPVATSLLIYPQYTKSAGIATVTAVSLLLMYVKHQHILILVAAVVAALSAFFIRDLEMAFIACIALAFLPVSLLRDRRVVVAGGLFAALCGGTTWLNALAYDNAAWQTFTSWNDVRSVLTDFGGTRLLMEQPELLAEHGYSRNDIFLLGHWFFADGNLADGARLEALLADIDNLTHGMPGLVNGLRSIALYTYLFPILLGGLLMLGLRPTPRIVGAWLILLLLAMLAGYIGRPLAGRVLMPAASLLLIVPVLQPGFPVERLKSLPVIFLLMILATGQLVVASRAQAIYEKEAADQQVLATLIREHDTVVWGDILTTEYLYRPLPGIQNRDLRWADLGQMTLTPVSVAAQQEVLGRGVVTQLTSEAGVRLLTRDRMIQALAVYCAEHHRGQLTILRHYAFEKRGEAMSLNTVRCIDAN